MFENFRVFETELAGKKISFETGKMACLANGSVLVRYGDTTVMVNVTAAPKPREGVDFFPLSVDFEEKLYAVGKIPGSFIKRESRPSQKAILTSRLVDRPIRPLFPKDMRNDVSVVMTVLSVDQDYSPEVAGMLGTSFALSISDIPWNGPIGGVQVGLVDDEIIICPNEEQRKKSDLQLTVAGTREKIVMIEAGANQVKEDTMLEAIAKAHEEIKKIAQFIADVQAEIGKPKFSFESQEVDHDMFEAIKDFAIDKVKYALDTDDKNIREERLAPVIEEIHAKFDEQYPEEGAKIDECIYKLQKFVVRRWLLDEGKRVDGRGIDEIRPLACEVGLIPRVHGSALFTRTDSGYDYHNPRSCFGCSDSGWYRQRRYQTLYASVQLPILLGWRNQTFQRSWPPRDRSWCTGRKSSGASNSSSRRVPIRISSGIRGSFLQRFHLSGFHLCFHTFSDGCRCSD